MHVGRVSTNALISDRVCTLGVWMCLHPNTLCFEKCEGLLNKMSKLWNKMFYTWEKIQICSLILTQIHWELKTYNFTPIYLFTVYNHNSATQTCPLKSQIHKFAHFDFCSTSCGKCVAKLLLLFCLSSLWVTKLNWHSWSQVKNYW